MKQDELCYPVKKVQFKTCVELYKKWKVTKLRYKTAPLGIDVEVEYADTLELINPDQESNFSFKNSKLNEYNELENIKCFPLDKIVSKQNYKPLTALMLHGAPGSHKDYQHLIKYFIKRNIRVIAPLFPNYRLTKKTPFCHSPAEKAEYIKDFLATIGVNRVDLLLCHSSGLFVAARLINDSLNAFNIHSEPLICKKCKKGKKCSKCEKKNIKNESKYSDTTTSDDENDELLKDFDEKVRNLEKKINDEKEKLNKLNQNLEKNNLIDKKEDLELKLKEENDNDEGKQNKKPDKKQEDEKQINTTLNEDEGYQEAVIDEQVKGQQKEARKSFSTTTIEKSKIYFGSLILINCVSHKRSKLMNPVLKHSLYEPSAFFYQLKISRSLVRFCGKIYLDIFGSPVDYSNFDNTILTLTTVLRSSVRSLKKQLERITKTNLPILMFFSESDRLITKTQSYELANFLNVNYIQRDFSDASHHNYDVYNYNKKKIVDENKKIEPEEVNNNEIIQETQVELQSTTSSDEYDSLRQIESEIESDSSSTKNSSSSTEASSFKSLKSNNSELCKIKETNSKENQNLILNQIKYPYAVSIKKGRHYSHITHSHVMDEHIGKLVSILNLRKN